MYMMKIRTSLSQANCNPFSVTKWGKLFIVISIMFMQHWTKMNTTGDKPSARSSHFTCCISGPLTGQQNPILMVIGGCTNFLMPVGDVWLLDVNKGMWSEVGILSLYNLLLLRYVLLQSCWDLCIFYYLGESFTSEHTAC